VIFFLGQLLISLKDYENILAVGVYLLGWRRSFNGYSIYFEY